MSTVAVEPAVNVNDETDGVTVGPLTAGITDTVYVTSDVETEVIVIVKLLV
jgi:ADP-ribosylglycohydrolase